MFITGSMKIPPGALPPPVGTPAAPGLTAGSGGSLPSETIYVQLTYVSIYGESLPSAETSVSVSGPDGSVTVASPTAAMNAVGYNVYAASASAAETLQNSAPIAIATNYTIATVGEGAASPPTANTSGSPWAGYALEQALDWVICGLGGVSYTLATYNCAGHVLLDITPDVQGQTYFTNLRSNSSAGFNLNAINPGLVSAASDQGTSDSLVVPDFVKGLQLSDLDFIRTPWGRAYLAYNQCFGDTFGIS